MESPEIIDPDESDLVTRVGELTGSGVDAVFDCAGVEAPFRPLIQTLMFRGHLEVLTIYPDPVQLWPREDLTMMERTVSSSIRQATDHAFAIELAASGKIDLGRFITQRIRVADVVTEGLLKLRDDAEHHVKILVEMPAQR